MKERIHLRQGKKETAGWITIIRQRYERDPFRVQIYLNRTEEPANLAHIENIFKLHLKFRWLKHIFIIPWGGRSVTCPQFRILISVINTFFVSLREHCSIWGGGYLVWICPVIILLGNLQWQCLRCGYRRKQRMIDYYHIQIFGRFFVFHFYNRYYSYSAARVIIKHPVYCWS